MPRGSISLSVRSGTPENYRTESILFNVVEVNLPFNTILGRSAMYKFMEGAAGPGDEDTTPSSSRQRGSTSTPRV
jgi:hypothetical protein